MKGGLIMREAHVLGFIGLLGGAVSTFFGGWNSALTTLMIFMTIDYVSGLVLAGVFHKSKKTKSGALESSVGLKGICRKAGMLIIVIVACRLDIIAGTNYFRDATVIALITNETISIIENLGLMSVAIPQPILKAIDVLKQKEETNENTSQE